MDTQPRRWGAYFLVRPLGGGGMGDVYLALSGRPGFEKACVIKRLTPETLDDPERVKRFRREAEIVRSLSHGAVAQTIAVDDYAGEPFIVQEYIEGKTLTQFVSAARSVDLGTLPVEIAIHIVREMSRALAYAHGAGVIHRDVALDNIMVTFSGEVRLIDFGIARSVSDATLTMPGTIVGRWTYTAPEVLTGARADQRADVYAAGVVLWELLTGRPPAFPDRASRQRRRRFAPTCHPPSMQSFCARSPRTPLSGSDPPTSCSGPSARSCRPLLPVRLLSRRFSRAATTSRCCAAASRMSSRRLRRFARPSNRARAQCQRTRWFARMATSPMKTSGRPRRRHAGPGSTPAASPWACSGLRASISSSGSPTPATPAPTCQGQPARRSPRRRQRRRHRRSRLPARRPRRPHRRQLPPRRRRRASRPRAPLPPGPLGPAPLPPPPSAPPLL